MYNQDGYMFVAISRTNRLKFTDDDLLSGSTEEKAQAAETYLSYCGRYEFHGETVTITWTSAYLPTGLVLTRNVWSNLRGIDSR
jgi:hypothetical protein